MAKKEKNSYDLICDLLIKIKSVFKKDLYIQNSLYICSGQYSGDSISGDILLTLSPKYLTAMKSILGDREFVYLTDVNDAKSSLQEILEQPSEDKYQRWLDEYFLDEEKNSMAYHDFMGTETRVQTVVNDLNTGKWESFNNIDDKIKGLIFTENTYVKLQGEKDYPAIVLGKQLFPLVTLKNIENLSYAFTKLPERPDLSVLALDFQFDLFVMNILYYYIGLEG